MERKNDHLTCVHVIMCHCLYTTGIRLQNRNKNYVFFSLKNRLFDNCFQTYLKQYILLECDGYCSCCVYFDSIKNEIKKNTSGHLIEINEKSSDLKMIIEGNFVQLRWIEMQWVTPLIDTRVRADISHEIDSVGVHIEADASVCVCLSIRCIERR